MITKCRRKHCVLVGALAALLTPLATNVYAQSYDNPSLGQKPVSSHPQDYKPLGIRVGTFMLHPGMELAAEWTDNVFSSYDNEQSDLLYHARPYVTAQSTWSRHSFSVRLAADFAFHNDYTFRDYEDYFLNMVGRLDVKTRSSINYNLDMMRLHEGLNNRAAEQGVDPTIYYMLGTGLGFDHQFNRLNLSARYDYINQDYDNSIDFDGDIIDNQDRDRHDNTFDVRLGYQLKTEMQVFIGGSWRQVRYKQKFDSDGLARSSEGYNLRGGVSLSFTEVLYGDFYVTYHDMSYDDPTLPNVDGWALGASMTWLPTQLTTVSGSITSNVQQTTNEYASGYLDPLYSLRVDHELLRDLQLSARISYRNSEYTLIANAPSEARQYDRVWSAGIGANYFINRSMYLSLSYDYSTLTSNLPADGFTVNNVWLVLVLEK
jgi:hypothetical protein